MAAGRAPRADPAAAVGPPADGPRTLQLDVFLAALLISTVIPVSLFLVCQRFVLRGAGLSGAVKG